jgi:hypothetical protein
MKDFERINVLLESLLTEGELNWNSIKYLANLMAQIGRDLKQSVLDKSAKDVLWQAEKIAGYSNDIRQMMKNAVPPVITPSQPAMTKAVTDGKL